MKMIWIYPKCKTTNGTHICTRCGFDASRDYTHHRFLCQLSESARQVTGMKRRGIGCENLEKEELTDDGELMAVIAAAIVAYEDGIVLSHESNAQK